MKTSYWFLIEPYVHVSTKGSRVLLYNTLNGKVIEDTDPAIVHLVKRLVEKEKLFVVKLANAEMEDPTILRFIRNARECFVGDLMDESFSHGKPVEMVPALNMLRDTDREEGKGTKQFGVGIMEYLAEISFYVNSSCLQGCSTCQHAYRQFLACTKGNKDSRELAIADIRRLLEETQGSGLSRVNIAGGDICRYSRFEDLVEALSNIPAVKVYVAHYENLSDRERQLDLIGTKDSEVKVLVSFPFVEERLRSIVSLLNRKGIDYGIDFVVQEEADLDFAEGVVSELDEGKFSFKACYNGKNIEFFRNAVFLSKEDILAARPDMREIFVRMAVNPLNFGKLFILSNGTVRANINTAEIGRLGRDSLYDLVYKEMESGENWRKLRTGVSPCKSCNYDLLCPPLTNYEHVMGKNNLCHVS